MKFFVHALFHHAVARIVLYSYPNRKREPIREVLAYTDWPNAAHSEGENQLHRELDCDSDVTASESMKGQ